jgi:hypothetical protein
MLNNDRVQSLNNRDAVVAFFSSLGYNSNARLEQTPANLGISPESTVRRIKRIERIANQEDMFQVYLFEVDSVTVDLTRSLARNFRDYQGHYLLVLTSDYEQIDFVLVETLQAAGENTGPMKAQRKRGFRPLVLSVKRRVPTRVDRRVLARFEYTEADPLAQYDKLLSAYSVAYWSEENFNNRALFSDYYLVERLRDRPEWREDVAVTYKVFEKLLAGGTGTLAGLPETNARSSLFVPAFKALGFAAKEGKSARDGIEKADYVLYDTTSAQPVTLALTYCWNRNLDGPDDTRDSDTPQENPSQTVITVLEQSPHDWAIVTNGKTWRLYSKKAHSRATNYYEVDLPEIMALQDPSEAFRYFWLFFRAASFMAANGSTDNKCLLDELLEGSQTYSKKLGERLKDHVFREIFPHFATGFVAGMGGSEALLAMTDEERASLLSEIYQGTLTFLYRLLFLSYAEARDLLPVKERRGYYLKSLMRMKEEIKDAAELSESARAAKIDKHFSSTGRDLYDRLTELFALINKGDPAVNLPTYNGGLFITDPTDQDDSEGAAHARFLRDHFIPDRHLAMGLDLLARVEDEKKLELVFIDYKSLGVRQLGSIYEGLLEFKIEIATEKLGVTKDKGREVFCPWSELGDRECKAAERRGDVVHEGGIYLSNDKSERKATGSYYTPDYIVQYIVQHTVGPVLHEKFEALRPKLREAQRRYRDSVELNLQRTKCGQRAQDPDVVVGESFKELAEELFDLKILDPAMGSGHFLVEVVDYVTDRIIDFLNGFPWNPVAARLRRMRESILEHMDDSGISVDHGRLTDTNLLKRHVLKRCVYGVDINPMAVELAKVSLWLDCFTLGAPLSFLDHHLKCGNSLIGTDIATVQKCVETEQLLLFSRSHFAGVMLGADLMRQVGRLSDVTVEQMNQSRREYNRARDGLATYKRLLDVYVSRWFGNEPVKMAGTVHNKQSGQARKGKVERDYAVEFLQSDDAERWSKHPDQLDDMEKLHRQIAERTMVAAKQQRFFHWELEFPEVYYGPRPGTTQVIERFENPGFDVVVGNPPYSSKISAETSKLAYLYRLVSYRCDPFAFFIEKAKNIVRPSGRVGLILPSTWMGNAYYENLRRDLLKTHSLAETFLFDGLVFADANVDTSVIILHKEAVVESKFRLLRAKAGSTESPNIIIRSYASVEDSGRCDIAPGLDAQWECIASRLGANSEKLALLTSSISLGLRVASVNNDTSLSRSNRFPDPLILGDNVERYVGLKACRFFNSLKVKIVGGTTNREVYTAHPKILLQSIRNLSLKRRLVPTVDTEGIYFGGNVVAVIPAYDMPSPFYLQALLASNLLNEYFARHFVTISLTATFLGELPIRRITATTSKSRRQLLSEEGRQLCRCLTNESASNTYSCDMRSITEFIHARLTAEPDEADIVHDILADLARDMVALNKEIQEGVQFFLLKLEGWLRIRESKEGRAGVESMTGKERLNNYLGDHQKSESELTFPELEKILYKNRSRLGMNLSDLELIRKLRDEYEQSLATLLPLKRRLAATDALIDQIVYRLYGLTDEEIAIVEGKDVSKNPISVASLSKAENSYIPVSRKVDPRELREILTAAAILGTATVDELTANAKDRALVSFGFEEAESVVREFTRLGWLLDEGHAKYSVTATGVDLTKGHANQWPYVFSRALSLAHEALNGRIVSRILGRLWELNPEHQGAVIIPKPQVPEDLSLDPDSVTAWIESQTPKWLEGLKRQMPGFVPKRQPEEFLMMMHEASVTYKTNMRPTGRARERFSDTVSEQFLEMMFDGLNLPVRDLEVWRSRLDWAGLTMTVRTLPGVAGWVWFPVGAFRKDAGEDFKLIKELVCQNKPFYVYEPKSQIFETKFLNALYEEYAATSREERVEYVPLTTVRDRTCYRLRIGAATFERVLASVFPKAIRGDVPYGMALEVDITPQERNRLRNVIPIVIDHTPRHIIAMRKK